MRRLLALVIISFTVTVAVVVGNRLSSEAMAVVVGIVCGVLASVPTSVLLLIMVRRLTTDSSSRPRRQQHAYPPVIVVNPNTGQSAGRSDPWSEPSYGGPAGYLARDFRIVGEEDEEDDW